MLPMRDDKRTNDEQLKIELLSQWTLEAESRNFDNYEDCDNWSNETKWTILMLLSFHIICSQEETWSEVFGFYSREVLSTLQSPLQHCINKHSSKMIKTFEKWKWFKLCQQREQVVHVQDQNLILFFETRRRTSFFQSRVLRNEKKTVSSQSRVRKIKLI